MNRNNKILVGVLALIVAMTIGYALFSDNITITGTAKAKGDFQITTTCTKGLTNEGFLNANAFGYAPEKDNNYKNDSCTVDGNKVNISAELQQPGAARNFTIKITNSGSIDAQFSIYKLIDNQNYIRKDYIGDFDTGEFTEDINQKTKIYFNGYAVGFEKSDGSLILATSNEDNIENVLEFLDESQENVILKSGESMYAIVSAEWNQDDIFNKALYKSVATIEIPVEQVTNP